MNSMSSNGNDLIQTLHDLSVETGCLNENAICAWFDTDSEDDKYLLNWLCTLSKSNTLSSTESAEYDEVSRCNSFLTSKECEKEMSDILRKFPGLMDNDDTSLSVQMLEKESEILGQEKRKQEELLASCRWVVVKSITVP